MADGSTSNYSFTLPEVGASEDNWGGKLNANWTELDTLLGGVNATEFAILDGATVSTSELNTLDGVTATAAEINTLDGVDTAGTGFGYIPAGGIIMWSGAIADIPAGWALCDGTNGTPDLSGKFIVHADADSGGTYAPGDTGGADSVTLTEAQMPAHNHGGATGGDGAHSHRIFKSQTSNGGTGSLYPITFNNNGGQTAYEVAFSNSVADAGFTSDAPTHTHSIATAGSGSSHENRPPFYALAFIQKL